jgi:hypothetical protein
MTGRRLRGSTTIVVTMTYGKLFPGQGLALADRLDEVARSWPEQPERGKVARMEKGD